ncbi:UNVERIFIED_CONTAM: hypothetical protein GTU68_004656 [Idotea baltica]|nr:hypothetical protein [Idotea baltica]
MPVWAREKLFLQRGLDRGLGSRYRKRYVYCEHHESHAASAFFPSPFENAAILTIDGVGEWATSTYGVGTGNEIKLLGSQLFPHSLGLLYSAFTYYCGFRVNSGEYKLMGLAPYGEPRFADVIRENLIDLKPDGSFRARLEYFNYTHGLTMTNRKFEMLMGEPRRLPESGITQHYKDVAASIQQVTEEIVLAMGQHVFEQTGQKKLCLAGGVALNCVANGRLLREGPFDEIWIQPAAGDAGGALGAAMLTWHQLLDQPRQAKLEDSQSGSLLGPEFSSEEIESFLMSESAVFERYDTSADLDHEVADLLAAGNVVGWFQGRMEFGPRSLGNRSILGDPRNERMQRDMNLKIKFRESFRPFAPIVAAENSNEWFDVEGGDCSPYMLIVSQVAKDKQGQIPAVTHVDQSARVQTISPSRFARIHSLIEAFRDRTGCPVLINTSFNVRGEPVVCSPAQAFHCFRMTHMDVLVLGDYVLKKGDQSFADLPDVEAHLSQFSLD